MEIEKLYRYPGAVSFTTEQTHLFNGRDRDAKMLWQLISARQVVLLYGKSGTGKSSLINAGIIPIIENEKKVKHFSIRLYNSNQGDNKISSSPLKTLITNLRTPLKTKETNEEVLIEQPWMNSFKKKAYPQGELWYWLKQWQIQQPEKTILLFFDQFEELFTYPPNEIEDFGEELKLLIYQNIPDFLNRRELFKELDETQTALLYQKVNLKLVFSIRSDRMALLNKLTPFIPDVLKYFYELDALTESEARQAIIKPAQLEGEKFISPNFEYETPVIDAIIDRVKNSNDDKIETATLQIILRFIEEHKASKLKEKAISLKLLGNIQDIFKDFYQTSLNKLNKEEKAIASKTIEERFIQNNQRIPFAGEYLKLEDKWTDKLLKQLEESTLLRKERDTAGRFIYEIGHDTLIEPIVEFANERKAKEEQRQFEEAQKQQAEEALRQQEIQALENKNLQQALDARKQLLKYALIAGFILMSLLGCTLYLWYDANEAKQKATDEQIRAEFLRRQAQKALNQVYYQQAKAFKDNADNILYNGSIFKKEAKVFYDSSKVLLQKIQYPDTLGTSLKKEIEQLKP